MSASSAASATATDDPASTRWVSPAWTFLFAALVMGGFGVARLVTVFGNNWVFGNTDRLVVAASVVTSVFLSCALFLVTAWLLYFPSKIPANAAHGFSTPAILVAFYLPFFWALGSLGWHLLPILPGFPAAMLAKPLDSSLVFVASSGVLTLLLVASLRIIRDRMRHGQLVAPMIALGMSSLTSYAAFCFMQA